MRLPLLVSASPSVKKTPIVLLREGVWIAEGNVIDSEVYVAILENDTLITIGIGEEIKVSSKASAKAVIQNPGKETSISIDFVRVRD